MNKHKKLIFSLILIFLISSLGVFIFGAKDAQAGLIDISFQTIGWIISRIGSIFLSIASVFFTLTGMLLDIALGLEEFTQAGVVQTGWRITRDLSNMLFVLILLIIAFATILRIETYGMKQILWKLIVIALLINFSLVIAGIIIDASQILTHFFYDNVKGTTGVSAQLAKGFNIPQVYKLNPEANIPEQIAGGMSGIFMIIFSIFLGTIFVVCAAFALGIGAFFLFIRLVALWILLILAPLAWLAWVLPATKHLFERWWSSFFKWTLFAPIYAFFIYLAIKATNSGTFVDIINTEVENTIQATGFFDTIGVALGSQPRLLIQFIALLILLFAGVHVAQKMSIYGADAIANSIKGKGEAALKWPIERAQQWAAPKAGKIGEALQKTPIGKIPGLRQAVRPLRGFEEQERATLDEAEKRYKNYTSDNLKSQFGAVDPRHKAAIAKILAGRGDFEKNDELGFTDKSIEESLKLTQRYGKQGDILKSRPDLAENQEAIKKVVSGMKSADMEKIQSEALTPEVISAIEEQLKDGGKWNNSHLAEVSKTNPALKIEIQKIVSNPNKRANLRDDVKTYLKSDAGKAVFGDTEPRIIT